MTGRTQRTCPSRVLVAAVIAVGVLVMPARPGSAADIPGPSYADLKAAYVYHFTDYLTWPDRGPLDRPFVIGIFGQSALEPGLRSISITRKVNGRAIVLRVVDDLEKLGTCDLLVVAAEKAGVVSEVIERLAALPVLTVGEAPGLAARGLALSFVIDGRRIRFELNRRAVIEAGLTVSSRLLKLARLVGAEPATIPPQVEPANED